MAKVVRLVRSIRISVHLFVIGLLVLTGLTGFCMGIRLQDAGNTSDHMRQIKQMLEIHAGENGGYPESLDALAQRYGPIPKHLLVDGWGNAIRYTALDQIGGDGREEWGGPRFARCDLRSAGSNGRFDDDDDVPWEGVAD